MCFKDVRKLCAWLKQSILLCLQDYGKESQAKDVIEEYFKAKK